MSGLTAVPLNPADGTPPVTYTITYDGNGATGGTVPTDSGDYPEGAPVTVLGNTGDLVRTGHSFQGWNTKVDGTGDTYTAGQTFTMGTANVTLRPVGGQHLHHHLRYGGRQLHRSITWSTAPP